jgi:transcriptional regulator with XRE-family HTH domain
LAEGNFIKRRRNNKGTKFSLYALKRWAKEKGYNSVEEYLKARGDEEIVGLEFACGVKDREKGYLDKLSKAAKISIYQYGNNIVVKSYGSENLVYPYVYGNSAKDKSITDAVFNESLSFLRGVLDGFLDGDSQHRGASSRVTITKNEKLANALMIIAKLVGREFRIYKSGSNSLSFEISNYDKRIVNRGIVFQAVRKIEDNGIEDVYDIEVEPIYTTYCGKGKTEKPSIEKRKAKWNNLYFLANGIFTHNSNHMPSSVKDRLTQTYEYIFHFVKSRKYFYCLGNIREPHKTVYAPFNLRVRDIKRGKGGVSAFGLLKASGEELKKYVYPEKKHDLAVGRIGGFSYTDPLHTKEYYPLGKNPGDTWDSNGTLEKLIQICLKEYEKAVKERKVYNHKGGNDAPESFRSASEWNRGTRETMNKIIDSLNVPEDVKARLRSWWHNTQGNPKGKNPGDVFNIPLNSKFLEANVKTASPAARALKTLMSGKLTTHVKQRILDVGSYLKAKLKESNLTVKQLAELTGIKRTTLEHYFRTDFSGQALPDRETWNTLKPILGLGEYDEYISEEIRNALPKPHPLGRNIGDFWSIATRPLKEAHFAPFPYEIPLRPILASCPPDGIVLDPLAGSGTVALTCEMINHGMWDKFRIYVNDIAKNVKWNLKWVLIEINPKYCDIARGRLEPFISQIKLDKFLD